MRRAQLIAHIDLGGFDNDYLGPVNAPPPTFGASLTSRAGFATQSLEDGRDIVILTTAQDLNLRPRQRHLQQLDLTV